MGNILYTFGNKEREGSYSLCSVFFVNGGLSGEHLEGSAHAAMGTGWRFGFPPAQGLMFLGLFPVAVESSDPVWSFIFLRNSVPCSFGSFGSLHRNS